MDLNITGELWGWPVDFVGQVTTSDKTLIAALIALVGVLLAALLGFLGPYKDRKMLQEAEFLAARKKAYYDFVTLITELEEETAQWDDTTITNLWKTSVEAGYYKDLESTWKFKFHFKKINAAADLIEHNLEELKMLIEKDPEEFSVEFNNLHSYAKFLGVLQLYTKMNTIDIGMQKAILNAGMHFSVAFTNILLTERKIIHRWQFWK